VAREIRLGLHAAGEAAEGWARVLRQDRLPWDPVEGPDWPIVIFDGALPSWCGDFVERGGVAVITGAPRADALLGPSTTATLNRFRPPVRDGEAAMPCLARVFDGTGGGEVRLHENRKARNGNLADVRPAVLTRAHGKGWLIYTGLPLAEHLAAVGDSLRVFTEASNLSERVATVDKAAIADTMTWMLGQAFAKLGVPFVRIARYPQAARSVFLFRVDVDGLFGRNCRTIAEVAEAHGIRGSFYFNASLCRAHPGDLSRDWLGSHEIAHHADTHDLFDSVEENRANLLRGMSWVERQLGERTTGYVAPRGLWNGALDQAMAELGHIYSSDFGLDFDSLPFFTPAGVVQIPVHPFSPERFAIHQEDAGLGPPSGNAVLHHYLSALERQVAQRRPAHLYGHPEVLGRMAHAVLPDLFGAVARLGLPTMTVAAFADWWIERDKADLTLSIDDASGTLAIETTGDAVEVFAAGPRRISLDGRMHELAQGNWAVLTRNQEVQP
jgi:peptidoglycan/xylan/chitin deacetylase (PgdA/CDA1 family)